jgi:glyoxylase-like metal-dependent hydrolase (beta-lactamase superfamily II)
MRVHILQTGTVSIKAAQLKGDSWVPPIVRILADRRWTEPLPIYAFAIEHPEGLIVVDTGETSRATAGGYFPWWHPYYRFGVREWVRTNEEIGPQLRENNLALYDVSKVLLTHLHTDHAGGLVHFPQAQFFVSRREMATTQGLSGQIAGYLPQHWPAHFHPTLIDFNSEPFGPFPASYPITRDGAVRLVPTPGHSPGHMSVVVSAPDMTYFLAGDVSYSQALMLAEKVDGVTQDRATAQHTLARVAEFCRSQPTIYLPSHDPAGRERLLKRITVT